MKPFFLACCVLLVVGVALGNDRDEIMELIKEHVDHCAEEKQMSPVDMDAFFKTDLEGEERTKYGCLHACILGRMELMKDNRLNVETFSNSLEKLFTKQPEKVAPQLEAMTKCAEEVKEVTEECDLGYEFSRCLTMKHNV
ncbi:unnamed protein product [Xylocopa violacea]|uniref:Uncharacterized protein n=1 Tax=Xylocopa violacea TaxID=135666 RepID=A0ABP1NI48_XYLVO